MEGIQTWKEVTAPADREGVGRAARLALGLHRCTRNDHQRRIVVQDRAAGGRAANLRAAARVGQRHDEALVRLHPTVRRHQHRDRPARLARSEADRAGGSTPPTKSVSAAGLAPLPVTAQLAVLAWLVLPLRLTVNVKAILPNCPSDRIANTGLIDMIANL